MLPAVRAQEQWIELRQPRLHRTLRRRNTAEAVPCHQEILGSHQPGDTPSFAKSILRQLEGLRNDCCD